VQKAPLKAKIMAENPRLAGSFLYCGSQNEQAHFSLAIRFSFAYNAHHGCPRDQWSWGELFLKWCEHGIDASTETGF
jgi:hypothetical protein